jgi:hypothetical protein
MSYFDLLTMHNLALLNDWLEASGELCIDLYLPHSAGWYGVYFIKSLSDLKALLIQETWPEIGLTIFREPQYPLRGIANDKLLEKALQQIPDGESYQIVSLNDFPDPCHWRGDGNSHVDLKPDFEGEEVMGQNVAIGLDPMSHNEQWFYKHSGDVFRLSVNKNQTHYANYKNHPERHQFLEDLRR